MREAFLAPSPQTLSCGTPAHNQRWPGVLGAGWTLGDDSARGSEKKETLIAGERGCHLTTK